MSPCITPERWIEIENLFHRVVECEPEQRREFLDEACSSDPELRLQVESLLSGERIANDDLEAAVRMTMDSIAFPLVGQTVSHYRVLEGLGGGGMGVVYRARDTKLPRLVALKFLPPHLTDDRQVLKRFRREANAASSLNHPNICTIYDIDEHQGQPFIVMEHMEGRTLKHCIEGRPLPVAKVVEFAAQIAEALEAAHTKGIIHRDIKPTNLFIAQHGREQQVKVLDFGLAKLALKRARTGARFTVTKPETISEEEHLTSPGVAIGTVAYMSPEQARGEDLDARTDLFSFGAVLYEMATGQQAFCGATTALIYEAILNRAPAPIASLNRETPAKLEEIIAKALEKDRELRCQTAAELRANLKRLKRDMDSSRNEVSPAARGCDADERLARSQRTQRKPSLPSVSQSRKWWAAPSAIAVILLAGAGIAWFLAHRPTPTHQLKQRRLTANPQYLPVIDAAISPDGKYLGYWDQQNIHVKLLDTGETHTMPMPSGLKAEQAFWTFGAWYPDSTRFTASLDIPGKPISFWSVPILGGTPQKLVEGFDDGGLVSPDGSYIAYWKGTGTFVGAREIWLMGPHGQPPHRILTAGDQSWFGRIAWSPAGGRIAYTYVHQEGYRTSVSVMSCSLDGTNKTTIITDGQLEDFSWIPPSRVILVKGTSGIGSAGLEQDDLWELNVDAQSGTAQGKPRQLTNWSGFGITDISAAADGNRLAFVRYTSHASVYVGDLVNNGTRLLNPHQLCVDDYLNQPYDWTADSRSVIFVSFQRTKHGEIYRQAFDGRAPQVITSSPDLDVWDARLSPDGLWVIFQAVPSNSHAGTPSWLYRAPVSGGAPQPLFQEPPTDWPVFCTSRVTGYCTYGSLAGDGQSLIITAFEPIAGKRKELTRIPIEPGAEYHWAPAYDGSQIAILRSDWNANEIRFIPLQGGEAKTVTVKGYNMLNSLDWARDSKSIFVASDRPSGSTLLHIDLKGNAQPLWRQPQVGFIWGIPSPDGRHLAMQGGTYGADVWTIENLSQ